MKLSNLMTAFFIAFIFISCNDLSKDDATTDTESNAISIPFEKHTLENGLTVIFHEDKSDPVVAVALTAHVGSAREKEGKTGFAHLFEHLLFLESENLGKGGLDAMSARIGGSGANGSTSRDVTNYYQTVPKDALEKMIWAEADKLGYFINTVTEPVLAKEKQVVKNEKRQSVDNNAYGHESYVVGKNLYPEEHPYNWQVIGSLEDLQNASLQDVKDFYKDWYTPNNAVLTIAGDFDKAQALEWVKKYFGEIKRGKEVDKPSIEAVVLKDSKYLYHEDNFAQTPRLSFTWPTVPNYHEDSYALEVLGNYLSRGKKAPLNQIVVEKDRVADQAYAFNYTSELAGQFGIVARAYDGVDLDSVKRSIEKALSLFEENGISQDELDRIKTSKETDFYQGLSSVLGKGFQLTQYEILAGDAGFLAQDMKNMQAVTLEDITKVYHKYIKDSNYIMTSFVPKGQVELAVSNSQKADVEEEKIVEGAEESFDASIVAEYERSPSSFDRSIEPAYGDAPTLEIPNVYKEQLSSGIEILGIEDKEVPLIQFQLDMKGGMLFEDIDKIGVSNMLAQLMNKGTATKTPEELEDAIEKLGANITVRSSDESISINASALSRNYEEVMKIVDEILLEPRWDKEEFELIKKQTISRIQQQKASPRAIASNEFAKLIYGNQHLLAQNNLGTEQSVANITIEDLKDYYNSYFTPKLASFKIVGDVESSKVVSSLETINRNWNQKEVSLPQIQPFPELESSQVYFYDVPNAKQSILTIGNRSIPSTDNDSYNVDIINYRLGGGGFASQLTQQLREDKGYTYGVRSSFNNSPTTGTFTISSGVRSNVTYESTALIKEILSNYGSNFSEEDLEVTKSYLIKSSARAFESQGAKLRMLSNIEENDMPIDYALTRQKVVTDITLPEIKELINEYINSDKMVYLIVGDKKTQFNKLEKLGFGKPTLLN
ncbi:zinc protease [Nonlabens dokdonensis]|uniref:Zinc protease n=2 Tax=Nonlabens dokdonensis TaxID=328515 RepID=A0ABX5PZX5_9FLAO|nr:pitrilysin family protein [Nonlabens dokdonensis]AGC75599.1 putative peptidase [Nonlabens dokdonensis DSW-6]PZX43291.1 zinc protease [Nonlabens dokdonensis]